MREVAMDPAEATDPLPRGRQRAATWRIGVH